MALDQTSTLFTRFGDRLFLTDAGLETSLIFNDGMDLPHFASFPLLRTMDGRQALERYFNGFLDEAAALDLGFVLDTVTWRASAGWGARMGWSPADIDAVNREAVAFAQGLRADRAGDIVINGVIGPHGDAYAPDVVLTPAMAEVYHQRQIAVLAEAGAEMLSAMTISSTGEGIGIAQAARKSGLPVVLSFTVETDGHLIGGQTLADVIAATDDATAGYPAWYGINCAHPDHFATELSADPAGRIGSIRANASRLSHAELDDAAELDAGDPAELAQDYVRLKQLSPGLRVLGGCCGTDLRHVSAIGRRFSHRH